MGRVSLPKHRRHTFPHSVVAADNRPRTSQKQNLLDLPSFLAKILHTIRSFFHLLASPSAVSTSPARSPRWPGARSPRPRRPRHPRPSHWASWVGFGPRKGTAHGVPSGKQGDDGKEPGPKLWVAKCINNRSKQSRESLPQTIINSNK